MTRANTQSGSQKRAPRTRPMSRAELTSREARLRMTPCVDRMESSASGAACSAVAMGAGLIPQSGRHGCPSGCHPRPPWAMPENTSRPAYALFCWASRPACGGAAQVVGSSAHRGHGTHLPEPPFAPLVLGDGLHEILLRKIGPGLRRDIELGVGGLPQQEIGEPLLARGPDQQVRIGELGGVELPGEHGFIDVLRPEPSLPDRP